MDGITVPRVHVDRQLHVRGCVGWIARLASQISAYSRLKRGRPLCIGGNHSSGVPKFGHDVLVAHDLPSCRCRIDVAGEPSKLRIAHHLIGSIRVDTSSGSQAGRIVCPSIRLYFGIKWITIPSVSLLGSTFYAGVHHVKCEQ